MRLRPPALHHNATPRDRPSLRISAWLPPTVRRVSAFAALLAVTVVGTGCSTPKTASGTLEAGKQQVTRLVLDAAHALPATVTFTPPTEVGTQPCRKTALGFVFGRIGAHRAEVPLVVTVQPGTGRRLLDVLDAAWEKAGYDVDRSRLGEEGFPQLRAKTPDGNTVVATAFTRPGDPPHVNLYAVSPCLRGS